MIAALVVAGLGWLFWKLSPEPAARYAFEFTTFVDSDMVGFRSAVGCYPVEAKFLERTHTVYRPGEPVFSRRLKSGKMFYVAVPNACSYVRSASNAYLSNGGWERPTLETPRAVVPLTFVTDGSREPETIRLFTSLKVASPDRPIVILSTACRLKSRGQPAHVSYPEAPAGGRQQPVSQGRSWLLSQKRNSLVGQPELASPDRAALWDGEA